MTLTIGSLNPGLGGFELGLQWAGLGDVKWQVERNEHCREVLAKHWPDSIQTPNAANLDPVDVVCATIASPRRSVRAEDSKADDEFYSIIRKTSPRFVAIVQRATFVRSGLSSVLGKMADLGFDAWWDRIDDRSLGAPYKAQICTAVFWYPVGSGKRSASKPRLVRTGEGIPARLDGPWPAGQDRNAEAWEPNMRPEGCAARMLARQIVIPQMSFLLGRIILEVEHSGTER